jgi:hypothetical protein
MAVATATFTESPYPEGSDITQRRYILHGPVSVSASPATYPAGGMPLLLTSGTTGLNLPGVRRTNPVTVRFDSRGGNGYIYLWTAVDLWTKLMKGNVVAVGQSIQDSNGNIQTCTTGGTAGSGAEPTWNTVVGGTTTDNTVVWTNQGISNGLLQIFQSAGSAAPLVELTQGSTIPANVSGDTIAGQVELIRG